MSTPLSLTAYLLLFTVCGAVFLFANLLVGWLLRPRVPDTEKGEVYECGEPTIGSSYVQFDLRFYVVALLFIIFDVEVAFFFPWATVFGKSAQLTGPSVALSAADEGRFDVPPGDLSTTAAAKIRELGLQGPIVMPAADDPATQTATMVRDTAGKLAASSLVDIAVFFAVLLVGFAYVWKRGDLDWVRTTAGQSA